MAPLSPATRVVEWLRSGDVNAPQVQKSKKYEKFPFPLVAIIQTKSEVHRWVKTKLERNATDDQPSGPKMPSYVFFHKENKIIVNDVQDTEDEDNHLEVLTGVSTKKDYLAVYPDEAEHLRNLNRSYVSEKKCQFQTLSLARSADNVTHKERCEQFWIMSRLDIETLATPSCADITEMEIQARRCGSFTEEFKTSCFSNISRITTAAAERQAQHSTNQSIVSCYGSTNLAIDNQSIDQVDHSVLALFANFCLQAQLLANISSNRPDLQAITSIYRIWDWSKCLESSALQALSKFFVCIYKTKNFSFL